jgi:hypothetical protein
MDQFKNDINIKGGNWEEISENRKWENTDGWKFVCNNLSLSFVNNLKMSMMENHIAIECYYNGYAKHFPSQKALIPPTSKFALRSCSFTLVREDTNTWSKP